MKFQTGTLPFFACRAKDVDARHRAGHDDDGYSDLISQTV
jgi:hypothetical protein